MNEIDLRRTNKSYVAYLNDLKRFRKNLSREETVELNQELESVITRLVDAKVSPEVIRYFQGLKIRIMKKGYIDGGAWATLQSFKDEIH